tara:strand:- start:1204 stop:1431 length:228 start_codon:yes stop_codon:yes gene_type:complete
MPISKEKYIELKVMYDFQRKKEYNKEKLKKAVAVMLDDPEFLFDELWNKMKDEDMLEAPTSWIPKDDKLKIEGEE